MKIAILGLVTVSVVFNTLVINGICDKSHFAITSDSKPVVLKPITLNSVLIYIMTCSYSIYLVLTLKYANMKCDIKQFQGLKKLLKYFRPIDIL